MSGLRLNGSRHLLKRIVAPLGAKAFIDDYFQQKPLWLRGFPGKFDALFGQHEFKRGLDRVTEIRAVFAGLRQATIAPFDIPDMVGAGATICVTGMELAHPKLARAARVLRAELRYPGKVSFRAYLSPPGAGFDTHFDARVATTLQIAGTKRWWFSLRPVVPFPVLNSTRFPEDLAREFRVPTIRGMRSVLLRPGDLLCLPAGVWHRARAETTSLALNMAFDHKDAGILDTLLNDMAVRLRKDPVWRQPLPVRAAVRNRLPAHIAGVLRERITALQRDLEKTRSSEARLRRLWLGSVGKAALRDDR